MHIIIKKVLVLFCLGLLTNLAAQKDTLYFDANWEKTVKADAEFYRLLPLEKEGDLYHIKDYHINGNLQMNGYWSNIEDETYEGETKWFSKNGKLTEVRHYKNGELNGEALYYSKNGYLRAKGTYRVNEYWSGTFYDECCYNGYIAEYKEGKRIGQRMYHANTAEIAVKRVFKNDSTTITNYFNTKGKTIGHLITINQRPKEGMLATYHLNDEDDVLGIEQRSYYKNSERNGKKVVFNKDGKQFSECLYKNDRPYLGTSFSYSSLKAYVNGKLEGEEIGYSAKMLPVTKGINKEDRPWNGKFVESYENKISSYKEGKLEGKQISYFTENLKKVKSYDHIQNNDKNGESAYYLKDGKELAKGIYKDDKPWNGTFYDSYNMLFSSFKDGKKHGIFAQYNSNGEILEQQEYENDLLAGIVKSKGYREHICECIYKNGEPYSGEVCEAYSVTHYEKGSTIKTENYERDYENDTIAFTGDTSYENGIISAQTVVAEDKTYGITFKDGLPFNGVHYISYTKEMTTYKNGIKEGVFIEQDEDNRDLSVGGFYKNNQRHGLIEFYEGDLKKKTTCIYKKGKPIKGTVINDHTFTTYKNGLKQGIEKEITQTEFEEIVGRQAEYDKGIILTESYSHLKNQNGEIAKGIYKNGKPYNGDFFKFESVLASFTHYENGEISGAQYVGFNDYQTLSVVDSMNYKAGKPYEGRFIESTKDRLHFHEYAKGKLTKTIVTKDDLQHRIKNTITYSDTGFIVTDEDSDLVMFRATYLNEEQTKVKVQMYSDVDVSAGTLEYDNNKITAIDINYDEARFKINYALVNTKVVMTLRKNSFVLKAYPILENIEKFTYKNFLNPEQLLVDFDVVIDTYIDGKKIATGFRKDKDMFDGIHIMFNEEDNTYHYFKLKNGKRLERQTSLTKEQLLKILKLENN